MEHITRKNGIICHNKRADYQSRVNDIAPHHSTSTNVAQNNEPIIEVSVENELVSEEPVNN